MKRVIFMFLVLLCAAAAVSAQNTNQVESQLSQLIQQNEAEYQRLLALRETANNEDWLNELQRAINIRQEQISALQQQIETLINDRSSAALVSIKLRELEVLMRSHNRYLQLIEEHNRAHN